MKSLVIYYSYSGHTKKLAEAFAASKDADVVEMKDVKRPGILAAYLKGCFAAMKGKAWAIQPLKIDLLAYDDIVLYSPVWAGNPPPAVNAFLEILPSGRSVTVRMVSGSGTSKCRERIEAAVQMKVSKLAEFEDVKA